MQRADGEHAVGMRTESKAAGIAKKCIYAAPEALKLLWVLILIQTAIESGTLWLK